MFKFIKSKDSRVEKNSILGTMPFDKETDYKIGQYSPLAYPLGKNKSLNNENIREAIQNMPDLSNEVELQQMSETDFYQLSYMDCLPNVENSVTRQRNKRLIKGRKN